MHRSKTKQIHRVSWAVMAGAVVLALGACDQKPTQTVAPRPGATGKAAVATERAAGLAERKTDPARGAAGSTSVETAKATQDAVLAAKVKAAVMSTPGLEVLAFDVVAAGGIVTLYGTADTAANRDKAAQVAAKVQGVTAVTNKLVIVAGS